MDIDRQAIERRDFPIARRGYEPATVDAHLRALAGEIEQLQRELSDGGAQTSLAATAGTQVQSILAAAEATAADLERDAADSARTAREQADRDAARTREEAIAQARAHVTAVAQATSALLERVGSLDAEVSSLVQSVRAGADRLAADLSAVEANMGELYDAASGKSETRAVAGEQSARLVVPAPPAPPAPSSSQRLTEPGVTPPIPPPPSGAAAPQARAAQTSPPPLSPPDAADPDVHVDPEAPPPRARIASGAEAGAAAESGDLDGARLVALNMALNGESREDAERYLADNFQVADRQKLIDEVYEAIEG